MTVLRVILNDHLSQSISSLRNCDKSKDIVLMCEARQEYTCVKHHKKKIAFLISAMRHFAKELEQGNFKVDYIELKDKQNSGTIEGEVMRAIKRHAASKIIITYPADFRTLQSINSWQEKFGVEVELVDDDRFLSTHEEFAAWAKDKKQARMEFFYREMRRKHNILMQGAEPEGGKWNYDSDNRMQYHDNIPIKKTYSSNVDEITSEVIKLVGEEFSDHFGDLEQFNFATTRDQALKVLNHFIENKLSVFGDYQDTMIEGEPYINHSLISFYLNCGLLLPMECVEAAQQAYFDKKAPLNCVEGFIRQILGWREFIRGIYWLKMPTYSDENFFNAHRKLPELYWGKETKMNCLKQCVKDTKQNAYAHHIQRLMVLGNFALLTGLSPREVNEWYLIVLSREVLQRCVFKFIIEFYRTFH